MKDKRSTIDPTNLQQLLDASASPKAATLAGQQQYTTPEEWARLFARQLPSSTPDSLLDPQAAKGSLLSNGFSQHTCRWRAGIEIDNRIKPSNFPGDLATGNCVTVWDVLEKHYPDTRFACQVANPPFGIRWKLPDGSTIDSTEHTWNQILKFSAVEGFGYFIANHKTIERLGINEHPWVYLYQKMPVGIWKQCDVEVGVVHWKHPKEGEGPFDTKTVAFDELNPMLYQSATREVAPRTRCYEIKATPVDQLKETWTAIKNILREDAAPKPYNIWIEHGKLKLHLSTRFQLERNIPRADVHQLLRLNNCHPLALTTEVETRRLLQSFLADGIYTISDQAKQAIEAALSDVNNAITPIMPPTNFEMVGYADECESLTCRNPSTFPQGTFTAGRRYRLRTGTYSFVQKFKRKKQHFQDGEAFTMEHSCELLGQDRYIEIVDDKSKAHRFMDRPKKTPAPVDNHLEHEDSILWNLFDKPETTTVAEIHPERFAAIGDQLKEITTLIRQGEGMQDFAFYPGQIDYLKRVGTQARALVAADVGCGKTLMSLTLLQLQQGIGPKWKGRALICAPQGTIKDQKRRGHDTIDSQWKQEIHRFAPGINVFTITCEADVGDILNEHGCFPEGIYIGYYESLFKNGVIEKATKTMSHESLCAKYGMDPGPKEPVYHLSPYVQDVRHTSGSAKELYAEGVYTTLEGSQIGDRIDAKWRVADITERYVNNICRGLGGEKNGITCSAEPCLYTKIEAYEPKCFDAVVLDEAQIMTNLAAQITQRICKVQTRVRYALSATPIPNIVSNLFSIMGWLCVDEWYRGERRSARWPYTVDEIERFNETFLSEERDVTQEELQKRERKSGGKCLKASPVIAAPARLLKLIKPTLAFISKDMCNPDYEEAKITDVRVPMGSNQSDLYTHWLDASKISCKNAWMRAGVQMAYLREVAAAPHAVEFGGPTVTSPFNPKIIAALELVAQILERGEQVVIVSSRIEQNSTLHDLLGQAIGRDQISRIDSTVGAKRAAGESKKFKTGETRVMLMGIKCAAGHSFSHCPNEIILSIEFSYGPFHQAKGRIDRVNSAQRANIWVILHKESIEESMYDQCATKQDAATICLHGKRIPRDFVPTDMGDVLCNHMDSRGARSMADEIHSESKLEHRWPELLERIQVAFATPVEALPSFLDEIEIPAFLNAA